MNLIKYFLITLTVAAVFSFAGAKAFAANIGKVDLDKVVSSYTKAQDVSADLKVKEAELQKFLADAQKKLKDTTSPVERKNLEDKLTQEFQIKSQNFRDTQIKQWKEIEDNVFKALETTAKEQKLDVILSQQSVLIGGTDVTDKVLLLLNSSK
jgi:Skp family chaperone for outer membrane proteins